MKSLHNLSYKTLFTILFLALAGIVFFLKIGGKTQKVSAAWWNDSWHYRQAINISSHTALESNVYITTSINIGTTTKAQIDDGDFRFISQSGENLSYYIVSGTGTTNVSFHILIPSFPASTSTIYAYYGNSTIENGFSTSDFSTQASNYTIGSLSTEEVGGGPIAYWKFDEGVGITTYDSSSNKKNGTFAVGTSSPSWVTEEQCISGKCLLFDGNNNQSISLANLISSNSNIRSQGITVQVWVKLTDSNKEMRIISQSISSGYSDISSGGIGIRSNNKASFIAYDDSGSYRFQDSNTTLQTNQWYFITGTFNPSDLKMNIYINGKLDSSSNVTNTLFSRIVNNDYNKIGTIYQNGNNKQFFGYLDEVKIYPYTRTADQIKQDYNSRGSLSGSSANLGIQSNTAPSLKSSLVAYYKFDEGNGNTSYDSTSQQKNATLVGSTLPTWTNGKFNKAIDFKASGQRVLIGTTTPLSGQATATLWYKRTSTASTSWRTLLGDATANIHHLISNQTTRNLGIWDGSWRDFGYLPPDDNQFHYYSVIYDVGTSATLYVDGVYKNKIYTTLNLTTNPIGSIGNWNSGTYWAGTIDEVKIYNKALTPDEIKQDYNQGSAISFGSTNQTIGGTTTSLDYCIPGDTSYCASPVAEWKMDEGVGTSIIDTSGNSNTGTFGAGSSAPTWAQGKIGKSVNFDGTTNKYISLSNIINLGNTSWTVSGWSKVPSNTSGRIGCFLCNYADNPTINLEGHNTSMRLYWNGTDMYGPTNLKDDKWHYLTWIRDKTNDKFLMYIDGKLEIGYSGSGSDLNIATTFLIGSDKRSGGLTWHGQIDQLKIYNYARTPAQVAYDYNRGGPVGWWKMDECQGSTIYDWSGNGNNGTLTIGSNGTQNSIGTCQIGTSAAWTNGATGKFNSSLNFDGTDDYITGSFTAIGITKPFTLSSWFKTSTTFAYSPGIISLGYSPVVVMTNLGKIDGWWYDGSSWPHLTTDNSYNDGKWHLVTLSYDGINAKLYIDSILQKSVNSTVNAIYSGFYIGQEHNSTVRYFQGQIDDYRIYNYALTPEQIKQVYNGGAINFN